MIKEETAQIASGARLLYAPASFGQNTLVRDFRQFNRIWEFDAK